jgi:hypothetical protein
MKKTEKKENKGPCVLESVTLMSIVISVINQWFEGFTSTIGPHSRVEVSKPGGPQAMHHCNQHVLPLLIFGW